MHMERSGIVTASGLNVRSTPKQDNNKIGRLERGTAVSIVGEKVGWYHIVAPKDGWVAAQYVALDPIKPTTPIQAAPFVPFDGPLSDRPNTRKEVIAMFGDPSRGGLYKVKADPTWQAQNIVELHGDKAFLPILASRYFPIHHDIEPYAREAFRRAEEAVPGYIQRAGTWGYNFRHMRHDPKKPLSNHSWGIAIDVNPDDNRAKDFGAGKRPELWGADWLKRWPRGLPPRVVEAFESCGFAWGGRWKGYCDPMHFEFLGARDVQV
jgi:hypothetical protein